MSTHSITEAQTRLPELIDRTISGETVVITRDGQAVAELRPLPPRREHGSITDEEIDWLEATRIGKIMPQLDAGAEVRAMREESEH